MVHFFFDYIMRNSGDALDRFIFFPFFYVWFPPILLGVYVLGTSKVYQQKDGALDIFFRTATKANGHLQPWKKARWEQVGSIIIISNA